MNSIITRILTPILLACAAASPSYAESPLKIGFLATFSGSAGALGQDQYDAFMLAVEQRGGKLGGVTVEVLKEDDQLKPEVASQIVQKLIGREHVPIITGFTGSNIMMAVARQITEKEVFLLSTNSGPSPLAGAQCSPYQFVVSWQSDFISEVVGKYATDKGYKKMVLMAPNYQGGKDVIAGFKRFFKGEVLDEYYTPLNQLDFSAEIVQLTAKKPDAIFAFYPGGLGINFVRQYQQAGLLKTLPLLTTGVVDGTTLPALRDSALGIVGGGFWSPDFDNPVNKQFVEAFEKKYQRIPSNFAAQAYDGALLLDSAIAKVQGKVAANKAAFGTALKAADFKSVRGNFKFGTNNFPVIDMHMFEVVKDSRGRINLKSFATPLKNHGDVYAAQCPLK
ncbi:ABC transporter substrate-binding protein [Glaciimonas immobilis]|uniref:Branched-chain amino acid transport system substrate-binding protein n=1 Tax=Glaciimonas immobilis TaxID=728004 RepID=A0A840RQ24_9BURK|nr:ABC transporter substrate-binding protein [Glaciimonas immobilis]KAF3998180.1 ABC transporter substrate-binding protein [Glaciimonas immobilis]MBB5199106.1 branched-chain amino acid transport system substrate-binding protein [Glaciimonas immobilis]